MMIKGDNIKCLAHRKGTISVSCLLIVVVYHHMPILQVSRLRFAEGSGWRHIQGEGGSGARM